VESGSIAVGDELQVLPSGLTTRVKEIRLGAAHLRAAHPGQSVMLILERDLDVGRGDLLARPTEAPPVRRAVDALVCWFSERPLSTSRRYLLRQATRETKAQVVEFTWRMDLAALTRVPADVLAMNDLGQIRLRLAQPIAADAYAENRSTGAFVLVDEATNDTVGAGLIL
jgi:sulfate adenylyltransferase subunit 1